MIVRALYQVHRCGAYSMLRQMRITTRNPGQRVSGARGRVRYTSCKSVLSRCPTCQGQRSNRLPPSVRSGCHYKEPPSPKIPLRGTHFSTDGSFRSLRSWLMKPRTSLKRYLPPLPRLRSSSTVPPVARAVSGSHVSPTRQTHDLRYGVSRFWHRYALRLTPLSAYDVP